MPWKSKKICLSLYIHKVFSLIVQRHALGDATSDLNQLKLNCYNNSISQWVQFPSFLAIFFQSFFYGSLNCVFYEFVFQFSIDLIFLTKKTDKIIWYVKNAISRTVCNWKIDHWKVPKKWIGSFWTDFNPLCILFSWIFRSLFPAP